MSRSERGGIACFRAAYTKEYEMDESDSKDPLHGLTLKAILEELVNRHGWPWLAEKLPLRCFSHEPSLTSSLRFLRRTEWARSKLERLYISDRRRVKRNVRRKWRAAAKRAHDAAESSEQPEQRDS